MSAGFANRQGAAAGKARSPATDRRSVARPFGLTVRRVKFACSLFVGALMLGVVSNAMLLQTARPPAQPAATALPTTRTEGATPPRRAVETAVDARPTSGSVAMASRGIDPMPVGTISAPTPARPKLRRPAASAKTHPRKVDAIAAFLRDGKSRGR